MPNLEKASEQKQKILSNIRFRGPSLPVQIANSLEMPPLFSSAFLSELKSEDKIKISSMKIGSSPLYYLPGQEHLLEKFVMHLNGREKEAFELLKSERVLDDEKQAPVMRVALRAIKDFAVPIKVRIDGDSKLFWKYFSLKDDEASEIISSNLQKISVKKSSKENIPEQKDEKKESALLDKASEQRAGAKQLVKKQKESDFGKNVRDYLTGKDIEVLEVLNEKKKEFEARVRTDTLFGKQEFYLNAKDKKSVSDNDFALSWQAAHGMKLPALVMSTGELSKKAKEHLSVWKNLIKWEKIKF